MKYKVGDKVKIVSSTHGSINKAGDVGTIVEYDLDENDRLDYRVLVEGRTHVGTENTANWHTEDEIELIQD
jgi:hypothetical protein